MKPAARPTGRTLFDSFAIMAGVFLVVGELRRFSGAGSVFWLIVGLLLIVLGLVDLVAAMVRR